MKINRLNRLRFSRNTVMWSTSHIYKQQTRLPFVFFQHRTASSSKFTLHCTFRLSKMTPLPCLETSGTKRPWTWRHIPEERRQILYTRWTRNEKGVSVCQPKCYAFFHLGDFKSILEASTKTCCIWQMSVNVCSNLVIVTCPIMHILACYLAMNMTYCHFWGPPKLLFNRHGREVGRAWFSGCVKLATHFYVVPRLKTSEAVLPLPLYPIIFHF